MKILQLSKKYRDLLHKKNPYYSSRHIPDEEEQRYMKYSNALYFVNVLYNHFNNIDKKE
jgi:hypothetical protein